MRMALWCCGLMVASLAAPATADDAMCEALAGATVLTADGVFIGRLGPATDADSIFNPFGPFGNKHGPASIWNPHGKNGDRHGRGSAFNEFALAPPRLVKNRQVVGALSVNKAAPGAVSPIILGALCNGFRPRPQSLRRLRPP